MSPSVYCVINGNVEEFKYSDGLFYFRLDILDLSSYWFIISADRLCRGKINIGDTIVLDCTIFLDDSQLKIKVNKGYFVLK